MVIEGGLMGQVTGGYFIRGTLPSQPRHNRWVGPTTDNKENINPATNRIMEPTRRGHGRSPLPNWYPRSPLRDISAILKAIERREQRRETTAARQQESPTELVGPPSSPLPVPQTPEPFIHTAPVATPAPPLVVPKPELEEYVEKLSESIEQLEKIVMRNVKGKNAKKTQALKRDVRRKTLLSMR